MVDGLAMPRTMFLIFFGCLKYVHEYGDIKKRWGQTFQAAAPANISWLNFALCLWFSNFTGVSTNVTNVALRKDILLREPELCDDYGQNDGDGS